MNLNVVITGNLSKMPELVSAKAKEFEDVGMHVVFPKNLNSTNIREQLLSLRRDEARLKREEISQNSILYILNPGGGISPNTNIEIGLAMASGTHIFCSEKPTLLELQLPWIKAGRTAEEIKSEVEIFNIKNKPRGRI